MTLRLTGINPYPIKAARGIALGESNVDEFGLRYDRRWMVVDESGTFLSQRTHPHLALVAPDIRDGALLVNAPEMQSWKYRCIRRARSRPCSARCALTTRRNLWRGRTL
jgi:uncharacterized protein YcbX